MNLLGQAIVCNCYIPQFDRYQVLGSITDQGMIEILRGHKNKTILKVTEFFISCEKCGFEKYIKLSLGMNPSSYQYEHI